MEEFCEMRRPYHFRAARDDRDGSSRYRGHERRHFAVSRVEPWNAYCASSLNFSGVKRFFFAPIYRKETKNHV